MSLRRRFKNWLGNKLAELMLGASAEEEPAPEEMMIERVEPAPPDAPLLGPEASDMLASPEQAPRPPASAPSPALLGSSAERLQRLRRL